MVEKTTGFSNEFISFPGETLKEVLSIRNMKQKELAVRTGMTEKHISSVINGTSPISIQFAKKLEYALDIDASFWINLQSIYERDVIEALEVDGVTDKEFSIQKNLSEIWKYMVSKHIFTNTTSKHQRVIQLRKFLGVSNLEVIEDLSTMKIAFRLQTTTTINPYVLATWLKLCEYETKGIESKKKLDLDLLRNNVNNIKSVMFEDASIIEDRLKSIFEECGILFKIVKHFPGAPVQGFIKNISDDGVALYMTVRRGMADIFWFTLMHEIAHILNGDTKDHFIDYDFSESVIERRANKLASELLLDSNEYRKFVKKRNVDMEEIKRFANNQKVQPFIVIGRLKRDKVIPYNMYSKHMQIYRLVD